MLNNALLISTVKWIYRYTFVRGGFLCESSLIYGTSFIRYNQEDTEAGAGNVNQRLVDHLMDRFNSAR